MEPTFGAQKGPKPLDTDAQLVERLLRLPLSPDPVAVKTPGALLIEAALWRLRGLPGDDEFADLLVALV